MTSSRTLIEALEETEDMGWYGVDLDGTLARYDGWGDGNIGEPIPAMVEKVKRLLAAGQQVKIFTARVAGHNVADINTGLPVDVITPIQEWCKEHLGQELEVTNVKDFNMIELWDDRARQVEPNTGEFIDGEDVF